MSLTLNDENEVSLENTLFSILENTLSKKKTQLQIMGTAHANVTAVTNNQSKQQNIKNLRVMDTTMIAVCKCPFKMMIVQVKVIVPSKRQI